MYCVFQGISGRTITKERPGMEERRCAAAGALGDPKLRASVVKTGQSAEAHQSSVGEEVMAPVRVKEEDVSEVPLKVPRFQYVDFPSLHQCIRQMTVPPVDSWLEGCPLERSSAHTTLSPKEPVQPKFKYVDYPSLHHCIKQLSVPPLESWSSGLARPRGDGGDRGRPNSKPQSVSQPNSAKGHQTGEDSAARTHRQGAYTAFPFPGPEPEPGSVQEVTPSDQAAGQHLSCPTRTRPSGGSCGFHSPPKRPSNPLSSGSSNIRGTSSFTGRDDGSSADHESVDGVIQRNTTRPVQGVRADHGNTLHHNRFWRTVPESVCPFCQKMFSDSEELRVHQRSHLEKRPH
ncbi:uncharacterized protein si:ch211-284e13.6 isoform X2 [Osmerus eperlanus]|uniref:uncharacterized protein si:ch211-284e13.6 isoform X2 n=1 Tax=Osmerus eperlanus TaxID=29151 RepID=UPI002E12C806